MSEQKTPYELGRGRKIVAELSTLGDVEGTLYGSYQDGGANILISSGAFRGMYALAQPGKWRFADVRTITR